MFSDQGVRLSMLSTVPVTSGIIFSSEKSKLPSLIGITILNNGLQFIMGEDDTFKAIIRFAKNVSSDYNLPGREMVQKTLLDNCFDNHIKNQRDKLLNRVDIYGLHFQGDGATINDTYFLNILAGGVYVPVLVHNIV